MKTRIPALLLIFAICLGGACALAQEATYVFPYEGFRYTQKENETVLTQTNLDEHEALISSLGTTQEAILASYMASGIVMEVIPENGGQIAISVADAGAFADVLRMEKISKDRLAAFAAQFEESGMYETVDVLNETKPVCVRLTSSAMYASMPVYSLRYATLHLGRLYMITQTIVGRAPSQEDDARMIGVLSGMKLLSTVSEATPVPTPVPTPTPEPTPVPTPGVAEVLASDGVMTVEGVPAFTNDPKITVTGVTDPQKKVTVSVEDRVLGEATSKRDGSFTVTVTLRSEGEQVLAVMTDSAEAMLSVRYEMPSVPFVITAPEETTFTGEHVMVRGETEPNATVHIEGEGMSGNVKANKNGAFSIRVFIDDETTRTFTLRSRAKGYKDGYQTITLTRKFTEREGIAKFRQKMQQVEYEELAKASENYFGRKFSLRGKVMAFNDYDGSPCALVCVDNPTAGSWYGPTWVVLTGAEDIEVGDIATFYLTGEGLTIPAPGEYTRSGEDTEAPVVRAVYVSDITQPK